LAEQRREETVADSAGNAAADSLLWAERLMSEHDQQLQLVREDHAQEVSHLQHLAAAAQGNIIVQLDKARKAPVSTPAAATARSRLREQAKTIKALKVERTSCARARRPVPSVDDVRSFASCTLFFDLIWCL